MNQKYMNLAGLYTALITPFKDGKVDQKQLIDLIHHQIAQGIEGLVLLGTTAEATTLTEQEQLQILDLAIQEINQKIPLIVGVSSNCTQFVIEKAKKLEHKSIDAFMVVNPYYNKPSQEGLYQHFSQIALNTSLPILLYNHPGRTGVHLELETLERLITIPSIIGLKETVCDPRYLEKQQALIQTKRPDFSILCGCDDELLLFLEKGCKGLVSVFSNAKVKPLKNVIHLFAKNPMVATELFNEWKNMIDCCSLETNPVGIKALIEKLSGSKAEYRLPLTPLSEASLNQMNQLLMPYSEDALCRN